MGGNYEQNGVDQFVWFKPQLSISISPLLWNLVSIEILH